MRTAAHCLLAFALACSAAGCKRGPSSWKDWIDEATPHYRASQWAKAYEACEKAYNVALETSNGPQVVAAYDCMAETARLMGTPGKANAAFAPILAKYGTDLQKSGAGLRLRNNYGVALVEVGDKRDGIAQLEAALDAYPGTPFESKINYRLRMTLIENLARAVRVLPEEDAGVRVSSEMLAEILSTLENARFQKNEITTIGSGDALAAIADLVRLRGDPKYAAELAAQAKEQRALEDTLLEGQLRRMPCESLSVRSLVMKPCYATLK
ncbi:hypothetical protein BWI17_01765 [Betaproteobacteria bacterium GR16-43]|nr:hypothetical protein BWI17_01765 [Betaproteobacteria bacterium GR16-43]